MNNHQSIAVDQSWYSKVDTGCLGSNSLSVSGYHHNNSNRNR